jgi:hypothetical protein
MLVEQLAGHLGRTDHSDAEPAGALRWNFEPGSFLMMS